MANLDNERISAEQMDEIRQENIAYEYLCHLEEAKKWIEVCIQEELPPTTELEENLRNGVFLAKIGHFINPNVVPMSKIYDPDQSIYLKKGLQFRHTDNINYWFKAMESARIPKYVYPDTFDVYDKRNMPKVIFCIHELSLNLYNSGKAPRIQDLLGKAIFTSEEINAMQMELDKSGIQMPSFAKIGQDPDSSVWDIVIAINKALDCDNPDIMKHLMNSKSRLYGVVPENKQRYLDELTFARRVKFNNTVNNELESSLGSLSGEALNLLDVAEIQECILKANETAIINELEKAIKKRSSKMVVKCLNHPHLNIEAVPNYGAFYLENLSKEVQLSRETIQTVVEITNEDAKEKQDLVDQINKAISKGDANTTIKSIENLIEEKINDANNPVMAKFYLQELSAIRSYSKTDLIYEEITGGVTALKAIWRINLAIQDANTNQDELLRALTNHDALLKDVKPQLRHIYASKFPEMLMEKKTKGRQSFFTHTEIQEVLDEIWMKFERNIQRSKAVDAINLAIRSKDCKALMDSLMNRDAGILCVHRANLPIYMRVLRHYLKDNLTNDADAKLTLDEVQTRLNEANKKAEDASKICYSLSMINGEVEGINTAQLLLELQNPLLGMDGEIYTKLGKDYHKALKKFKQVKANNYAAEDKENGSWIYCYVDGQHKYYQNLRTHETSWTPPENFTHSILLTQQDIGQIIQKVNANYLESVQLEREKLVTLIQAYSRGYLLRKAMAEREYHLEQMEDQVVLIQRWWRSCLEVKRAKKYVDLVRKVGGIQTAAIKIQSYFRMYQAKKIYDEKKQVSDVYAQRNHAIQELMTKDPLHYVGLYLHLLKVNDIDYEEEIELHKIRSQVVKRIRSNRELEQKVNDMDLKIALLIKNQLSAQELLLHGNKLSRIDSNRRQTMDPGDFKALHALNKESRFLLEGYQNLFYTLQTDPRYLARLIYSMSPGRSAKFIDSVIYTLYNYGSTPREECLLLQLFKHALEQEVMMKVERVEDICKGTPLVFKMIVDFNKTGCGHSCLRELLEPLVENILEDESLHLSTDPVEVYKRWVNEQETSSGVMSQLPYDLPSEEAEKIPEVASRIAYSVKLIEDKTEMFMDRILHSVELLPYGIRYTSKVLFDLLKRKFPDEDLKKVMKAVGNLLYYRYMIAAIPAADTFGVVTLQPGNAINSIQRKNLGAIAKVLQHAAAFQLFDERNKLSSLNGYLEKCHNKCLKFLKVACNVEDPEVIFCMDNYSEATLLAPPQVNLSLQEIVSTHQLLLENRQQVAPEEGDKLHQLLNELGTPITLETNEDKNSANTICLSLTNKFFEAEEASPFDQLFLTTKQMVIQFLQCQTIGRTFDEMLRTAPTVQDEEKYSEHRGNIQCQSVKELLGRYSNLNELRLQIIRNLRKLEDREYVTRGNDYRDIIEGIAKMIANRRMYRERRKDEIFNLRQTLDQLNNKSTYYHETLDYYNTYVNNCLERMAPKSKRSSRNSILGGHNQNQFEKPITVKYSATKLHEKGVLLEIAGLDTSQLKHVSFVITASKKTGVYIVKATFMGAAVETVDLDIQTLLQQQYEGVTVLEMFGKAKININLLLHLLNKKFVN